MDTYIPMYVKVPVQYVDRIHMYIWSKLSCEEILRLSSRTSLTIHDA